MAKSIPVIITNTNILVYDRAAGEFKSFSLPGISSQPNIPFYHAFAKKIAESQHYFKAFIKNIYPNKTSKNILAIVVPDDTSTLESIFINEFFLNSGACKAVAQITMGQALQKDIQAYISISNQAATLCFNILKTMKFRLADIMIAIITIHSRLLKTLKDFILILNMKKHPFLLIISTLIWMIFLIWVRL